MKFIEVKNSSQNNLKNVSVNIPLGKITVICGLSGSGKSSLAFETLYAEGQRRYLENLSNYVKQYVSRQAKPQVKSIENLPPALALEQKNNVRSSRSWVATASGLSDHLRLLFEKMGTPFCKEHNVPLTGFSSLSAADLLIKRFLSKKAFISVPVRRENIKSEAQFLGFLKKQGFLRFLVSKNGKLDFSSLEVHQVEGLKTLPKEEFFILIDRLVIEKKEKNRLRDSLEQAFKMSSLLEGEFFLSGAAVVCDPGEMHLFSRDRQCPYCKNKFSLALTASLFSFNSPMGACPACKGAGTGLEIDEKKVVPNPKLSLEQGAVLPFTMPSAWGWEEKLKNFCKRHSIQWSKPWCNLTLYQRRQIWEGKGTWLGVEGYFAFLEGQKYKMHIRVLLSRFRSIVQCSKCQGMRLRRETQSIFLKNKTFNEYMEMSLEEMEKFFKENLFFSAEMKNYKELIERLQQKIKSLNFLGLSYLTLNRPINTLSGGEFQRLNLSNQLGMAFSQMLYVLDEPTVGLHPRDTYRMLKALKQLKNLGNTVVVVEHDQDIIENGDFIIEMGPEAGHKGGQVIWAGTLPEFKKTSGTNTSKWLTKSFKIRKIKNRPVNKKAYKFFLSLKGCSGHNLKNIHLKIPLNRFVVVTGVSGSGKSSLIGQTLYPALIRELKKEPAEPLSYDSLSGYEFLKDVLLMSQTDIKQSVRSSPISYIGVYNLIRFLFATEPFAIKKGLSASFFSLNVDKGRCLACKGLGYQEIDMVFMDPISIVCEECQGKRFQKRVLDVKYRGKNIFEVLNLTIEEARVFFKSQGPVLKGLAALSEVGLSYLRLGQSLSSLSGGERQRLKLAQELLNSTQMKTLYILDEPTKGLHFKEIQTLLKILQRLVDTGGSVLVVEHNLEVIKEADYVIDIGPEAGYKGGKIVAEGPPEILIKSKKSHTARYLAKHIL